MSIMETNLKGKKEVVEKGKVIVGEGDRWLECRELLRTASRPLFFSWLRAEALLFLCLFLMKKS